MSYKDKFIKFFVALMLVFTALGFSLTGLDEITNPGMVSKNAFSDMPHFSPVTTSEKDTNSRLLNDGHSLPREVWENSPNSSKSESLAQLFQLLFILFIISPPLIVIMLFLIWKELKNKNRPE